MAELLWTSIDATRGPASCWPCWLAPTGNSRRPKIGWPGVYAPVIAYRITYGPVPPGMEVQHSCDNGPCCNQAHLSAGTHAKNMADMAARGRAATGERNARTKLTDEQVATIRTRHAEGWSRRSLSVTYGIRPEYVSQIIRGLRRPASDG
jgi:hypothetical protein